MGAPMQNTNAVKHGQRSNRAGLVHAKLGKRFASAYGHCNQLRRAVELLVRQQHGSISLMQQARIQSLLRLAEGIRACEKSIADHGDMGPDEIRSQRGCIAQWTLQRDGVLRELLGDANGKPDPWTVLDASNATDAMPSNQKGQLQ